MCPNNHDEDGRYPDACRELAGGASQLRRISWPFTSELERGKRKRVVSSVYATSVQRACWSLEVARFAQEEWYRGFFNSSLWQIFEFVEELFYFSKQER